MKAFASSFLALALTASAARAAPSPSHDAWITTKTKIALITTSHVPSSQVHVDTIDGRVFLHGKVASALMKANAAAVAKSIEGVKDVRDLLQVVPPSQAKEIAATDAQLKTTISVQLKGDGHLAWSDITVKSVDKGIVLLGGTARNLSDYLAALEFASIEPGVRGVASEVKTPNILAPTDGVAAKGKSPVLDSWITMTAKLKLLGDGDIPALDIAVDTRNGDVTLFGIVPTAAAKSAAEAATKSIDAVRSVSNELQVVAESKRENVDLKDDVVTRDVKLALKTRADFKHVDVTVKNGVARLTGKLPSGWQRVEAATLVRSTKGVRSVADDLRP